MGDNNEIDHCHAFIGNEENFWLYDSRTGFDLTRFPKSASSPITPRITIETTTSPITVDPIKTALVVIDMQNFFLSPALGRPRGAGHDAVDQLVQHAVPAARKAGIRIVWLNWGLSEQDLKQMSPGQVRTFGFEGHKGVKPVAVDRQGKVSSEEVGTLKEGQTRQYKGAGSDMGMVVDPSSRKDVDAGRFLMRNQWNTALLPPLDQLYEEGRRLVTRPDVWIHKNRLSGMWKPSTPLAEFLEQEGLRTLLFTGVNTDQCVAGTLVDCFNQGYDCVLLNDGCGTSSPGFAQQAVEWNTANVMGFQTTCMAFAEGVDRMLSK